MAQQNLIAVEISDTDLAAIKAAITVLKEKLMPHLQTLLPQERLELPKMGDKTVAFVQKSLEYGQQNKDLVPAFLDLVAMAVDVKSVSVLRELLQLLAPIYEALQDSLMQAGSEAYQGALVFYSSARAAMKVKAPNSQTIVDDLSARFPGAPTKKKP